ncbi:hypothetical protein Dimus_027899 [Dionaea muscipula]
MDQQLNEDGFLEELLALGSSSSSSSRETWESNPTTQMITNGLFLPPNSCSLSWAACFDHGFEGNPAPILPDLSYFHDFSSFLIKPAAGSGLGEFYAPSAANGNGNQLLFPDNYYEEDYSFTLLMMNEADHQQRAAGEADHHDLNFMPDQSYLAAAPAPCAESTDPAAAVSMISSEQRRCRAGKVAKKVEGQPSKNLMAERRRRKRLNDRLSMLRSVVPKISKMDRTSILGDTIDYMKELLEKIDHLQAEQIDDGGSSSQLSVMSNFKRKDDVQVLRTSPKFDVERRTVDTVVEISCAGKPGLLLSTVDTLEEFGLEIQQCVISCFNDFSFQASCSELQESEQRDQLITSEEIKQALFENAGYGGRCL